MYGLPLDTKIGGRTASPPPPMHLRVKMLDKNLMCISNFTYTSVSDLHV